MQEKKDSKSQCKQCKVRRVFLNPHLTKLQINDKNNYCMIKKKNNNKKKHGLLVGFHQI